MPEICSCTNEEVIEAEQTVTSIHVRLELEKRYANELWIGCKLDWNVEMRILATISRLFLLLTSVHAFLVGNFRTLWERVKPKRLIVPLDRTEVILGLY